MPAMQDGIAAALERDPEKWVPAFPRDKREAFARRSCSNKKLERGNDSKKSHLALAGSRRGALCRNRLGRGLCGDGLGRRAVPAAGRGRGVDGGVGLRLGGKGLDRELGGSERLGVEPFGNIITLASRVGI